MTMIARITKAYVRTYSDNSQTVIYVEWIDDKGKAGRTESEHGGWHMQALSNRAKREGIPITQETW